ncbi:MAG: hypothetical protein QNJ44_16285, partial [Rhodobacter sp.]|nr:hypothetical protein [Rhodobacter sp.]
KASFHWTRDRPCTNNQPGPPNGGSPEMAYEIWEKLGADMNFLYSGDLSCFLDADVKSRISSAVSDGL